MHVATLTVHTSLYNEDEMKRSPSPACWLSTYMDSVHDIGKKGADSDSKLLVEDLQGHGMLLFIVKRQNAVFQTAEKTFPNKTGRKKFASLSWREKINPRFTGWDGVSLWSG